MKKNFLKLTSIVAMLAISAVALVSCDNSDEPTPGPDGETVELKGTISTDMQLDANKEYLVTGPVFVEGSLSIPAGMTIKANAGFDNYILVLQGGQIFAEGSSAKPIIFTCVEDDKWGGLIINGKAPISGAAESGNEGDTEINSTYKYGGTDAADNSGVLTYVKLLNTGAQSSDNVEHNGLTLNGVGNGTKIENIFVDASRDDAIEFFGGSVNVTNFLAVNSDDDMFDFTQGYTGTLKNCYGIWESDYTSVEGDPRGVEADGNFDGLATETDKNQSNFKIENMTIENNCVSKFMEDGQETNFYMHDAIKLRRGAKATMTNVLVKGSGYVNDLIDLTDKKGNAVANSSINVTNSLTNALLGKEKNVTDGVEYDITVGGSNTGCTADFSWTGYEI